VDLLAHIERGEQSDAVLAGVMALPADLREVVTLYYLRDCSQREIAGFLELTVATINNRLHAARTRLRRRMTTMVTETLGARKLRDNFTRRVNAIVRAWNTRPLGRFQFIFLGALDLTFRTRRHDIRRLLSQSLPIRRDRISATISTGCLPLV
jgi:hypothetical protein